MKRLLSVIGILSVLGFANESLAFTVSKSTTGTSTETSRTSSGSSTVGSCVGDSTASKSSSGSGSTTSGCTSTPPNIDDDGDGMISSYEVGYSAILDKYDGTDAKEDADRDYISNLVEYLRALTPDDADSDNDTIIDGDDVNPASAEQGMLSVNGLYKGSANTEGFEQK